LAIIRQIKDDGGQNNILAEFKSDVTSQWGEDGIIRRIFDVLPESSGWCVEFGAWDGKHFSNTYNLIANENWSGVLIEANEEKFGELVRNYAGNLAAHCVNRFVDIEGENCLDNILSEIDIPKDFDLLSIDVDSCDYHVWESVKHFQPKLVIVEFNPSIPNDIFFVQDPNFEFNHGNSLCALIELGKQKGYELIATTNTNGFFIRSTYFGLFGIDDNSINKMRDDQPYATKILQLYDGTLLTVGMTKMIWRDMEIGIDQLQVLPPMLRRFGGKVKR